MINKIKSFKSLLNLIIYKNTRAKLKISETSSHTLKYTKHKKFNSQIENNMYYVLLNRLFIITIFQKPSTKPYLENGITKFYNHFCKYMCLKIKTRYRILTIICQLESFKLFC